MEINIHSYQEISYEDKTVVCKAQRYSQGATSVRQDGSPKGLVRLLRE